MLSPGITAQEETAIKQAILPERLSDPHGGCEVVALPHTRTTTTIPSSEFYTIGIGPAYGAMRPDGAGTRYDMNLTGIDQFTLTAATGTNSTSFGDESSSVGTSFLLKANLSGQNSAAAPAPQGGGLLVARALWSYSNGEMGTQGPTLEWIEVAEEWRRHGVGRLFYLQMEAHFCNSLEGLGCDDMPLFFSACNVSVDYGCCLFLEKMKYEGDGEEMAKSVEGYEGTFTPDNAESTHISNRPVASGPMTISSIMSALPKYNQNVGTNIEGRRVAATHTKPCTDCGTSFDENEEKWYFTEAGNGAWGADKRCAECMATLLGGSYIEEDESGDSEDDDWVALYGNSP
jgi:hypothetical protein